LSLLDGDSGKPGAILSASCCSTERPGKSKRVVQAMLQMDKIDINRLKQAYEKG
jgi:hypothetical protein